MFTVSTGVYTSIPNIVTAHRVYPYTFIIAAQGVQFDEPSRGAAIQRSLPEVHGEEVKEASSMDVLREIGAEIEGFHSMLEASLIAGQLTDCASLRGINTFST